MGVREWIRGLVLKLQVGGGLVQCSNQGQIDFTCLRFRHLSAHCRHTHIYSMWTHTRTHQHIHSALTPSVSHTPISCIHLHLFIHAHAKQREAFHTTSMCKPRSTLLEGKLNTLNWTCQGVSGSMVSYKAGAGHTGCTGSCTFRTRAHIQTRSQNN